MTRGSCRLSHTPAPIRAQTVELLGGRAWLDCMDAERAAHVNGLLKEQQGVIARWQLLEEGCTESEIEWFARGLRVVHHGVYLTGHAPLSPWQRWMAATLTESGTVLARWSAAALHGLRVESDNDPVHVLRQGSSGRRRYAKIKNRLDALDLRYSDTLAQDITTVDGIETTTVARTILDLCMPLSESQRDRLFRDAIRLKKTTREELAAVCLAHRGGRGVARLRALLATYEAIPIERTRSDAEIQGLVVLEQAGVPQPLVNVPVAGYEGDLVDLERKVILELDGPQYHQVPERDAVRNEAWRAAGFTVVRRPTQDAYRDPARVVDALRPVEQDE
jgi:hypothetical protein